MLLRGLVLSLSVIMIMFLTACSSGKGQNQQQNPAAMASLAGQQAQGNGICANDANCASQCRQRYPANQQMLNSCLNSTTGKQGKVTASGAIVADSDLIQTCDEQGQCLYLPVGHVQE